MWARGAVQLTSPSQHFNQTQAAPNYGNAHLVFTIQLPDYLLWCRTGAVRHSDTLKFAPGRALCTRL